MSIDPPSGIVKRVVVAGDFHIPHHSDQAIQLLENFLKDYQPDVFVINGDFLDCPQISKYARVPGGTTLEQDINLAYSYLSDFRRILPKAKIYYLEGNHEFRIRSYLIARAPELYDAYYLRDKLCLKQLNIEWVGTKEEAARWTDTYIQVGDLHIGHWDRVNQKSGYTASNLIERMGVSVIQSHVHRFAHVTKRLLGGRLLEGVEIGCMCDLNPTYGSFQNWQTGWTCVEFTESEYHIKPVLVKNYECIVNGKKYSI